MTDKSVALVPSIVREINFYGDVLLMAMVGDVPYVALRPIADFLGLDWSAQYRRVQRDDVLVDEAQLVSMTAADGRQRDMFSLPLEFLPGWLFGITSSKAAHPEYAPKIKRYRRECFRVLWQAVQTELLPSVQEQEITTVVEVKSDSQLALMAAAQYDELLGVTNLVREHLEILTGAVMPISEKVDYMVRLLETLVGKQEVTETKVARIDERTKRLTPEHTRNVAEFVEQMVHRTEKAWVPLDHYKIYGRIKHHFRTNSYKEVADERFSEVMDYLREMLRQALAGELPQQTNLL
jgi:hypothetical protein